MTTRAIPDPVRAAADARPDAPAVIGPGEVVSYAELDRRVGAAVERLRERGLGRSDRLAVSRPTVSRPTDVSYLVLLLAAFRTGVVVAPLSTRLPPGAVPDLLRRIGCRTLVAAPEDRGPSTEDGGRRAEAWLLDDPATLVFTSGSTGTPKAALHTLGNHVASARGVVSFLNLRPGDRWLLDLPLYHVGGLAVLVRCVLAGAAVVLPDASLAETMQQGVTHASMVATQLFRALRDEPDALAGLKAILLGGSAIPPGLLDEAHARGLPVHTSYGMTEMASTVTATPPGASRAVLSTSGLVLPHREVRLTDDGEVLVRGEPLFAGYVEGGTVERATDPDGWFPTGDLGAWERVEGERMLRVVGRKDHLFISGGENVQPEEVEAALGRLPGVRRAVVVPVDDAEFGQRPAAFVEADVWAPGAWRDALDAELPRFKVPATFHPWPEEEAGTKVSRAAFAARAERFS